MEQMHLQRFQQGAERGVGKTDWFVGDEFDFVTFDSAVLADGRVSLRSVLFSDTLRLSETFLYEVVGRHEALDCASCMVMDAEQYLEEVTGHETDVGTGEDFIDHLQQAMGAGLH